MVCQDKRSQLVQELQRECETLQGIDRLRLIHTETKKNVFLLCNLPLDITVDRLIHQKKLFKWKSNIEKALLRDANRILPLSSSYLCETYPDLFSSKSKAKREIENEGLSEVIEYIKSSKKPLMFNNTAYHLYSYRFLDEDGKGKQGRHQKALAPRTMSDVILAKHLKGIFYADIEIIQSTMRGLDDIVPIPSDMDHYQDEYDKNKKYYSSEYNVYYIVVDE